MYKFNEGDVVMVVDDQYEEDGLDSLASEFIAVGDVGVVHGFLKGERVCMPLIVFNDEFILTLVPCRPGELHYIGRL